MHHSDAAQPTTEIQLGKQIYVCTKNDWYPGVHCVLGLRACPNTSTIVKQLCEGDKGWSHTTYKLTKRYGIVLLNVDKHTQLVCILKFIYLRKVDNISRIHMACDKSDHDRVEVIVFITTRVLLINKYIHSKQWMSHLLHDIVRKSWCGSHYSTPC